MKKTNKTIVRENKLLELENERLRGRYEYYKGHYSYSTTISKDQEIIEAVKYAMKMSHPDNNGNAEDFMKFRKLYKEITEQKGN